MITRYVLKQGVSLENIMKDKFAVYMFGQKLLSREGGIEIVGLVDAHLRPDEFVLDQMAQEHFQRLPVLLVHGEQEKRAASPGSCKAPPWWFPGLPLPKRKAARLPAPPLRNRSLVVWSARTGPCSVFGSGPSGLLHKPMFHTSDSPALRRW